MSLLAQRPVDLVLSDIYMPGEDGLSLLSRLREGPKPPKIVLMTARGTVETATIAARLGVADYVAKPFDLAQLLGRIAAALAPPAAGGEPVDPDGPRSLIVGSHPSMVEVYNAVARVARLPVTVLVLGETGTGKELVARALHQFGAHPDGPFVAVHCGAIPDTLLESELFGHVRGAFTGADRDRRGALREAQHGTVFLDEIGDVSPSFQTKLLRFLQEKTVRPVGAERSEPVDVTGRRRDAPRPRRALGRRELPPGSLLPPRRLRGAPAGAARAPLGPAAPRRALPRRGRAGDGPSPRRPPPPPPSSPPWRRTPGPATSASWSRSCGGS